MSREEDLREWANERVAPKPTPGEVQQLLERAAPNNRPAWFWASFVAVPSVAVATLVAVWVVFNPYSGQVAPIDVPTLAPVPVVAQVFTGHVEQNGDVFDIEGTLTAEAEGYELAGTVEVEAAKRTEGSRLSILTEDYVVEVVGTHFIVISDPFEVAVSEGVVAVISSTDRHLLNAGDRFVDGHLIRATKPQVEPPPALADLRSQLVAGDVDATRKGLKRRLRVHPTEAASWTLLAQLETRAGQAEKAVAAWHQVIAFGDAQHARYEAAILLGTRPEAIPLLREFLKTPDPLAPEARLRLAQSLLANGYDLGLQELQTVIDSHPGTAAAKRAKEILASP